MPYGWLEAAFTDIAKQGIHEHEVLQVLGGAHRLPRPMRHADGQPALAIYGRTAAGRLLAVYVRLTGGRHALILGAREPTSSQREEFEVWESSR